VKKLSPIEISVKLVSFVGFFDRKSILGYNGAYVVWRVDSENATEERIRS
jgi:hypothetical protein